MKQFADDMHRRELALNQLSLDEQHLKSSMLPADIQVHLQGTIEALRTQVSKCFLCLRK